MTDLEKQLRGYSLTTAEILYHMPDHPKILQTYVWQEYDVHPHFPRLVNFLIFWNKNLDGKLHTVRVAHRALIRRSEIRIVNGQLFLN